MRKINPGLGEELLGRCRAVIEATQKEYVKEKEETVHTFLESLFDFSIISNFLSAIGINRTTYLNPELYVQPSGLKVTNQLIVELSKASKATKTPKGLFLSGFFCFFTVNIPPNWNAGLTRRSKPMTSF